MRGPSLAKLEGRFLRYLTEVRGLGEESIRHNIRTFGCLRSFAEARRVRSARHMSLDLVYAFLEDYSPGCGRGWIAKIRWHISNILRFLHFAEVLPRDLSREMIAPCTWSLVDVPEAFSEEDVALMLTNFRTETPYDLRERAMMLLLIYCGLRTWEICRLRLGDIDWRKRTLTVRERKNRVPLVLPLVGPVEEALRDYLAHSRPPDSGNAWLFTPILFRKSTPLTPSFINYAVKKFLSRCGLQGSARNFRHTLATRLINSGVSLEAVAALLGHCNTNSSLIYTKVHLEALRDVAENWSALL